jgi:hypothetical protein
VDYLVVVEKGKTSYGAYVPDLPGCVAVAETRREVLSSLKKASPCTLKPCVKPASLFRYPSRRAKWSRYALPNNRWRGP